ncbi:MAG: hypothetical protein AB7K64_13750 [Variibacter sp.]
MKALILGCHSWMRARQAFVTSTEVTSLLWIKRAIAVRSRLQSASHIGGVERLRGAKVARLVVEAQAPRLAPQEVTKAFQSGFDIALSLERQCISLKLGEGSRQAALHDVAQSVTRISIASDVEFS